MWIDPEIAGYVATPKGQVWYRLNGAGLARPCLLGITGGPGLSHHYLLSLTSLSDQHPVLLYDQLDTGNSSRPGDKANWTIDYYVDEIESIRRELGIDALVPVGHSWGGLLAYEYALKYPSSVAALVLVSPCLSAARWTADANALVAGLPQYAQKLIRDGEATGDFEDPGYLHANEVFKARHLRRKGERPPHYLRSGELFNETLYNHINGPSEFTMLGTLRDYEGLGRIGEIEAPVLFVCGEHDEARPSTMHEFAGMMRDAIVAVIPEVAHMSMLEDEVAFTGVIRNFLERRTAKPPADA
jgi:proline iminopeptidase